MQPETIRELYLYNHWANQRSLASAAPLSAEQFTRSMGNSFGSVRDTLAHILAAEWVWLIAGSDALLKRSFPPPASLPLQPCASAGKPLSKTEAAFFKPLLQPAFSNRFLTSTFAASPPLICSGSR
jgi:hypothetical protein